MFKSLITVLFSIFLNFSLSLAGDLKLSCDVEPAWIPQAASSEYITPKEIEYTATKNAFVVTAKPRIDWIFLYGWFEFSAYSASPKQGNSFVPFRTSYSNEIGIQHDFSFLNISAGWTHNCQHQIMVASLYDRTRKWNDIGYDKVFIKFHWSTK